MTERKFTNEEAVDIIEVEGLDYAVQHYCRGDRFEDPVTHLLWDVAAEELNALVSHLKEKTGREDFE